MVVLHVLRLENNKYYVGTSNKPANEYFNEHLSGNGYEFTKRFKPLEIIESIPIIDTIDGDEYVKTLMSKYGINNVRGGSYTTCILPKFQLKVLEEELCFGQNKCYKCLKIGHIAKNCYAEIDINGIKTKTKNKICNRCGRTSHRTNDCYATFHIDGSKIYDSSCSIM